MGGADPESAAGRPVLPAAAELTAKERGSIRHRCMALMAVTLLPGVSGNPS
jgi:hypothetical protein